MKSFFLGKHGANMNSYNQQHVWMCVAYVTKSTQATGTAVNVFCKLINEI